MTRRVRKAVFPVAGLGTRFLPATKASPKEMLPIVDKPIIQYAAEEAVAAGIDQLIFVTGRTKRAIEDHFDNSPELEAELASRGKEVLREMARAILPPEVACIYVRQAQPLGLGHAVLCARPAVGDEPFVVILPDDLIRTDGPGCVAQMLAAYESLGGSLVAVQEVPRSETGRYGVVSVAEEHAEVPRIRGVVEKPAPEEAPSTLGIVGRYLFSGAVFDHLERTERGSGGEIQLTDGIAALLEREPVRAFRFAGRRYDCGSKVGFLEATVDLALEHPDLGEEFRAIVESRARG